MAQSELHISRHQKLIHFLPPEWDGDDISECRRQTSRLNCSRMIKRLILGDDVEFGGYYGPV